MTLYLSNLTDLILTLYAVQRGGVELNPLMRNPTVMVVWKVFGVGVLCWWLSREDKPLAQLGLRLCTAVYAVLLFYHLFFICVWR